MNETEIDRIAAMTHALRPDWPLASIRALLSRPEIASRPRRDVAVAMAWVACEAETKTPARVFEAGPWWKAAQVEASLLRYPPKRNESCQKHPGEWPDTCRGCAGDRLAGDDSTFNPRRTEAGDRVATLKALHAQAVANLCSHGVNPRFCKDHKPQPENETQEPA